MIYPGIGYASPDAFSCRIRSTGGRFRKKSTSKRDRSSAMPDLCSRKNKRWGARAECDADRSKRSNDWLWGDKGIRQV